MNWEKILETDKIKNVNPHFYFILQKKLNSQQNFLEKQSLPLHFWMSVAAGILLCVLLISVQQFKMEKTRMTELHQWINHYYMNEMQLENIEKNIF